MPVSEVNYVHKRVPDTFVSFDNIQFLKNMFYAHCEA